MHPESDREILYRAGITDIDQLIHAAAQFVRAYLPQSDTPLANLTPEETAFLTAGGAGGVDSTRNPGTLSANLTTVAAEYALLVAGALTPGSVAELLRVPLSQIHQRINNGSLYAVKEPSGKVCPGFQFSGDAPLPGLEDVLAAISHEAHPVAVQRFFLTPTVDLESKELGRVLSPREWLITGHSAEPVVVLAGEL